MIKELRFASLLLRYSDPVLFAGYRYHFYEYSFPGNYNNQPIYFYQDNTHHLFVMYLIIRCPSCRTFTYVDRFQKWKLCPICGHAHEVVKAPAYLEVEQYLEAEHIVKQMEKHLHATKKTDFSPEETAELRHHYTEALRKKAKGHHA
jgi:acetyl-CoA carboxylase beta subunit